MGRQVKRVSLDFDWPLNETWKGYVSPPADPCTSPDCDNGMTVAGKWVYSISYLLLMLDGEVPDRHGSGIHPHPWLQQVALAPRDDVTGAYRFPGEHILEFTEGLAGRPAFGRMGHDSIDQWAGYRRIVAAAGLDPAVWGICPVCDGRGHLGGEAYESWEDYDPPEGPGYQLWENTSEGSPQSPVFETAEELADYATEHCGIFGGRKQSREEWLRMIEADDFTYEDPVTGGVWI